MMELVSHEKLQQSLNKHVWNVDVVINLLGVSPLARVTHFLFLHLRFSLLFHLRHCLGCVLPLSSALIVALLLSIYSHFKMI